MRLRQLVARSVLLAVVVVASLSIAPAQAANPPPATWRMVGLGDSIPYGGRYCGNCTSYVVLFARAITRETGHPVSVVNDGVPGLTTAQLLARVRTRSRPPERDRRGECRDDHDRPQRHAVEQHARCVRREPCVLRHPPRRQLGGLLRALPGEGRRWLPDGPGRNPRGDRHAPGGASHADPRDDRLQPGARDGDRAVRGPRLQQDGSRRVLECHLLRRPDARRALRERLSRLQRIIENAVRGPTPRDGPRSRVTGRPSRHREYPRRAGARPACVRERSRSSPRTPAISVSTPPRMKNRPTAIVPRIAATTRTAPHRRDRAATHAILLGPDHRAADDRGDGHRERDHQPEPRVGNRHLSAGERCQPEEAEPGEDAAELDDPAEECEHNRGDAHRIPLRSAGRAEHRSSRDSRGPSECLLHVRRKGCERTRPYTGQRSNGLISESAVESGFGPVAMVQKSR